MTTWHAKPSTFWKLTAAESAVPLLAKAGPFLDAALPTAAAPPLNKKFPPSVRKRKGRKMSETETLSQEPVMAAVPVSSECIKDLESAALKVAERLSRQWHLALAQCERMRQTGDYSSILTVSVPQPVLETIHPDILRVAPHLYICAERNPRATEYVLEVHDAILAGAPMKVFALRESESYFIIGILE
jgi:hypothetical protein